MMLTQMCASALESQLKKIFLRKQAHLISQQAHLISQQEHGKIQQLKVLVDERNERWVKKVPFPNDIAV